MFSRACTVFQDDGAQSLISGWFENTDWGSWRQEWQISMNSSELFFKQDAEYKNVKRINSNQLGYNMGCVATFCPMSEVNLD